MQHAEGAAMAAGGLCMHARGAEHAQRTCASCAHPGMSSCGSDGRRAAEVPSQGPPAVGVAPPLPEPCSSSSWPPPAQPASSPRRMAAWAGVALQGASRKPGTLKEVDSEASDSPAAEL